jgi:hypothetical protein
MTRLRQSMFEDDAAAQLLRIRGQVSRGLVLGQTDVQKSILYAC